MRTKGTEIASVHVSASVSVLYCGRNGQENQEAIILVPVPTRLLGDCRVQSANQNQRARGGANSLTETKINIIGVGSDGLAGLTARARELLGNADVVVGADQALNLLPELSARKVRIGADLQEAVRVVEGANQPGQRIVIVASGDPLFYG